MDTTKDIDLNEKNACVALVGHVVTSMQKWKSIYNENNDTAGIYNKMIAEDGKFDSYLIAFMKMQDKGEKLEKMDVANLVYYVNTLYPAIGIILACNGEFVPDLNIIEILQLIKWK